MTTFFLTRHGETVWHAENRYAGLTDVALTPRGLEQGDQLAAWAATASLTGIWSSTLSRAELTARKAATAASLPLTTDARFRELDFGQGEGLTKAEMKERFPASLNAFQDDPVTHHLPGGEHPAHAASRFCQALDALGAASPDGRFLVVAHSTVLRLVLCTYLGIQTSNYRRVFPALKNCSLTELTMGDGQTALMTYNADATANHTP
ncbi:putative phosphoglycerate mutase [Arthrobacter sp. CAN_A6]|uniref:histidine phosphatase family protein n=1 Tax=Arthrobacter sp. CAN_A6 TaxID=2787721 RepID=UPI0018CA09E1